MSFKNVIVDFTGFKLNKSKSTYNHIVYDREGNHIAIDYDDDDDSCDVYDMKTENGKLVRADKICSFYDYNDVVNEDETLKYGKLEAVDEII